jgi:hypothetical protein
MNLYVFVVFSIYSIYHIYNHLSKPTKLYGEFNKAGAMKRKEGKNRNGGQDSLFESVSLLKEINMWRADVLWACVGVYNG